MMAIVYQRAEQRSVHQDTPEVVDIGLGAARDHGIA